MADSQRIEDLRRRVQKDPASIAFAQLAEECRRAGQHQEAVDVCRAGLAIHPGYLSARVTLGRALIELDDLDTALGELDTVLKSAAENLAAIRGVAEIHHRRGELGDALVQYRAALALARNDPDLQQTVSELARQVEPLPPPASADGLSFEQMQNEFLRLAPAPAKPAPTPPSPAEPSLAPSPEPARAADVESIPVADVELTPLDEPAASVPDPSNGVEKAAIDEPAIDEPAIDEPALRTIAALERWLDAIHVARAKRSA